MAGKPQQKQEQDPQQQAVQVAKKGTERLVDFFHQHQDKITSVLPYPFPESKLIGMLKLAIAKDYKIAGCTSISAFNAVATALRCGLEIAYQESYLVPFGKECVWVPDYRGLIKIAYKAQAIRWIRPVLVRASDVFEFDGHGNVLHKPMKFAVKDGRMIPLRDEEEAGKIIGGYCSTMLASGDLLPVEFTPLWELEKIKKAATSRLKRQDGPWYGWTERQYLKTLVKREWHWIPRDDRMIHAIEADNSVESSAKLPQIIDIEPMGTREDLIDPDYIHIEDQDSSMPQRASATREPGEDEDALNEDEMRP